MSTKKQITPLAGLSLAIDFYKTDMTLKEIRKKYHYQKSTGITSIAKKYDPNLSKMPREDDVVLVLDKSQAEKAQEILKSYGIKSRIPAKFELTEEIESKINEDE